MPPAPAGNENDEYVVDKILDRKLIDATKDEDECTEADYYYLVRWEGYDHTEDTWEPLDNLESCQAKMQDFRDRLRRRLRARKSRP